MEDGGGGDFEHFVAVEDFTAEDAVFLLVALEGFDALDPFPDDGAGGCGADPADVVSPASDVGHGDVDDEEDDGDKDGDDGDECYEAHVSHARVVEGVLLFGERVVDDPGGVEEAEGDLEEVAECGDGVDEGGGAGVPGVDEVVEDAEDDGEGDES